MATEQVINPEMQERAILVGVILAGVSQWTVDDHLDELEALSDTAGAEVMERVVQRRMKPDSAYFIGAGKVSDVQKLCREYDANLVIFDDDLSPVQVRNLEKKLNVKVLDRSGLILDIFATRARTREAKVQVELAQMQYYYPRLTKMWSHLRGQQGGVGFRGPGETQLEVDRRVVQRRITQLKKELDIIARQRKTRREGRQHVPTVALVGYTNVGKSTLLNALSDKQDAFVEDRLFATLDPKIRRVETSPNNPVLVIDTVGFIRKLPHHLVASFRSTLEEAITADLIVHVVDISHPQLDEQMAQTEKVLEDLEIKDKPQLLVFNKIDRLDSPGVLTRMQQDHPGALFISATRGLRVDDLKQRLEKMLDTQIERLEIRVEPARLTMLDHMNGEIKVLDKAWDEGKVKLILEGPSQSIQKLKRYFS